jgi:hypothetical protein
MTRPELQAVPEWRPIPGWEGYYQVSDAGQVASVDRMRGAPRGVIRAMKGRILRPATTASGHLQVHLHRDGHGQTALLHRLVLLAFVGPAPEGHECCHSDGDPMNNHLSNLRWDTDKANSQDTLRHGANYWANRTTCPQGHPYSAENTQVSPKGWRRCRTCRRAEARDRMRALRAERQAVA